MRFLLTWTTRTLLCAAVCLAITALLSPAVAKAAAPRGQKFTDYLEGSNVLPGAVRNAGIQQATLVMPDGGSPEGGIFFTDPALFLDAVNAAGKVLKATEGLEEAEAVLGPGAIAGMADPLDANTNNGIYAPGDIEDNVLFQSNTNGTLGSDDPGTTPNNTRTAATGEPGLAVATSGGGFGFLNVAVVANSFEDSLDIEDVPGTPNHTAMGIDLVTALSTTNILEVRVWDKNESLLGEVGVILAPNGLGLADRFLGILIPSGVTIGRVNIWDTGGGAEGIYGVDLYLPGGGLGGACCFDCADCLDVANAAACGTLGGNYAGDGTSCATTICPGVDVFSTPAGHTQTHEFNPNQGGAAIPADFFGPVADPFVGSIPLEGDPIPNAGGGDTIVERLDSADLPVIGSTDTIQIEIVALSLTGINPITVTFNGGQDPEGWDVRVCLSKVPPPGSCTSSMTLTKTHANGGVFDSTLCVQPSFIFTKVSNPNEVRVLDTGNEGYSEIQLNATGVPWVHNANDPPEFPGGPYDSDCDGVEDKIIPCTNPNFTPGVLDPDPGGGGHQKKVLTDEQEKLAEHGVLPANPKTVGVVDATGVVNSDYKTPPLTNGQLHTMPLAKHFGVAKPNWAGVIFGVNVFDLAEIPASAFFPAPGGFPGLPGSAGSLTVWWHPNAPNTGKLPVTSVPYTFGTLSIIAGSTTPANNSDVDATVQAWNIFHVKPGSSFRVTLFPSDMVYVDSKYIPTPTDPFGCGPDTGCPCYENADVVGDGPAPPACGPDGDVDPFDHIYLIDCVFGQFNPCKLNCDVNCDGIVDPCDVQVAECALQGIPQSECPCCFDTGGGCVNPDQPCEIPAPPPGKPGCCREQCCSIVCQKLPHCCDVWWDEQCVQFALQLFPKQCLGPCDPPTGECIPPLIGEGHWAHYNGPTVTWHFGPGSGSFFWATGPQTGNIGVEHEDTGPIPTVTEWGLILMTLLLLTTGTVVFTRRRLAMAGLGGGATQTTQALFVAAVFVKVLAATLTLALAGFAVALYLYGELATVDIVGALVCAPVFAYMVHLWILPNSD